MNDLRKAAQIAVEALEADPDDMVEVTKDHWEYKREQAWKILRAALAQPEPLTQEIERLQRALRYEENRFSRIGTHGPDCWKWGPSHYECALRRINND